MQYDRRRKIPISEVSPLFTYFKSDIVEQDKADCMSIDRQAVVWDAEGTKWYLDGELHRDDEPAVTRACGDKEWYQHGVRHRDDGPAVTKTYGGEEWYQHGKLHRDDGPAVVQDNLGQWLHRQIHGPVFKNEWWIEGEQLPYKLVQSLHNLASVLRLFAQTPTKRQKLDDEFELTNVLSVVARYLHITDWIEFLYVSKTCNQYFSQDSVWSDYEIPRSFLGTSSGFTKLPKKTQCLALIAIRKTKNPVQCWELLWRMPKSVLAMVICRHYTDLIDNSSDIFERNLSKIYDHDKILPVVRNIPVGKPYYVLVLRECYIEIPTRLIVRDGRTTRFFCTYEPYPFGECIKSLFTELRTLPFQRKNK